nr:MAG TPA: hypothetical protein [Caudoviricetes sp.]
MLNLYAKEGGINSEDNNVQTPVNKKPIEINLRKLGRQLRREAKQNAKNAFYNKLVKPTLPQLKYN